MIKSYKFKDLLKEQMKDPEFRKEWEETQEEYDLACTIIEMRIAAGMSQKELAEKAKTSQPAIARLESGSYRNYSMAFLRKIGRVFGVRPYVGFRKDIKRAAHTPRHNRARFSRKKAEVR
jgi:ribosome-binding protein aMBF1 (putative translation factor)